MNNVREIERINERELDLAVEGGASWHDDYKDSAYIFVGNLDKRLTEGDVIAIFSQYGEILDINLPRVPEGGLHRPGAGADASASERSTLTSQQQQQQQQQQQAGKPGERRGFGFLLYEDQRSTVLAVDNLNGFSLVGRTLRVDHVRDYKMPDAKRREEAGEDVGPSRNAAPRMIGGDDNGLDQKNVAAAVSRGAMQNASDEVDIDAEDPMAAYFKAKGATSKSDDLSSSRKSKHGKDDESERKRRKEERQRIREERDRRRAQRAAGPRGQEVDRFSRSPDRSRDRAEDAYDRRRYSPQYERQRRLHDENDGRRSMDGEDEYRTQKGRNSGHKRHDWDDRDERGHKRYGHDKYNEGDERESRRRRP